MTNQNEIENLKERINILEEKVKRYANRAGFLSQFAPEEELNKVMEHTSILDLICREVELDAN